MGYERTAVFIFFTNNSTVNLLFSISKTPRQQRAPYNIPVQQEKPNRVTEKKSKRKSNRRRFQKRRKSMPSRKSLRDNSAGFVMPRSPRLRMSCKRGNIITCYRPVKINIAQR